MSSIKKTGGLLFKIFKTKKGKIRDWATEPGISALATSPDDSL
jgi:hypothetical protein